jgi:hypothetical protein
LFDLNSREGEKRGESKTMAEWRKKESEKTASLFALNQAVHFGVNIENSCHDFSILFCVVVRVF